MEREDGEMEKDGLRNVIIIFRRQVRRWEREERLLCTVPYAVVRQQHIHLVHQRGKRCVCICKYCSLVGGAK